MKHFVAYPSKPETITTTIESTINNLNGKPGVEISSWRNLDITGRFLIDGIQTKIDSVDCLICDITFLNFNVLFEIAYAIAKNKRVLPIINKNIWTEKDQIENFGIFDTLGYFEYENSNQLEEFIRSIDNCDPLEFQTDEIDKHTPIYVLRTLYNSDATVSLLSRIKKTRIGFRSFDPSEQPRLSLLDAYRNVNRSVAVIVLLLSDFASDYKPNNYRGAFIAGLAYGLEKELLILQEGESPIPLDYRDFVSIFRHPDDIHKYINELAPLIVEKLQSPDVKTESIEDEELIVTLNLGAPSAENEITDLSNYYLETDAFNQVISGQARLAVGRKGTGKTALFYHARNTLNKDRDLIVVDLKPEGHQLKRLKNNILKQVQEPVQEHLTTAFWEYLLLLEICNKILAVDRKKHMYNQNLYEPYRNLFDKYGNNPIYKDKDFSERYLGMITKLSEDFSNYYSEKSVNYLTPDEVTNLVYRHDIPELGKHLSEYLVNKSGVVILFDNIDKGWPTYGIEKEDTLILRCLMDATRKLERLFNKKQIDCNTIVFIRSDVYELLIDHTPDRGKESIVSLDWTDKDLLKQFMKRRFEYNGINGNLSFEQCWRKIFTSHYLGEETSDYIINRSLMRPRNLLNFVNQCKGNAVNLKHSIIDEDDIKKAEIIYSTDVTKDIGYEIRDVLPEAGDLLYEFIGRNSVMQLKQVYSILDETRIVKEKYDTVLKLLIWFGFLGVAEVVGAGYKKTYIHDVLYDMKKLTKIAKNFSNDQILVSIHPAFMSYLELN